MPLLSMLQFNLLKPIEQRSAESDQQKINFGQHKHKDAIMTVLLTFHFTVF